MIADIAELREENPRETLRHDPKVGVAFLQWLDTKGRHNLCAIDPESGAIKGVSFRHQHWEAMERFIEQHPNHNIYFSANEPVAGAPDKKLSAADIARVRSAFVDCDPPKELEKAGKSVEARGIAEANAARAFESAGALIDTGGGFQVIWRLPEKLPATETNGLACEAQNRGLATLFEADKAVTDVPRILRLPGTVNWPDEAKRKRGRTPRQSSVRYRLARDSQADKMTLEELAKIAPPVAAPVKAAGASKGVDAAYPFVDMKLLETLKTYDDLPRDLRERFEARSAADTVLQNLWDGKLAPMQKDETGSGYALALAGSLKAAGNFTPLDFGMLLKVWPHGPDPLKVDQRYIGRTWLRAPIQPTQLDITAGFEPIGDGKPAFDVPWDEPANLWAETSKPADLPHGVVPEIVELLARDKGRRLGVEPGAVAAVLITALGSLVPARNRLQMRQFDTGWTVHPVLWAVITANSGKNKSATLTYGVKAAEHVENKWRAEHREAERRAEGLEKVTPLPACRRFAPGSAAARPLPSMVTTDGAIRFTTAASVSRPVVSATTGSGTPAWATERAPSPRLSAPSVIAALTCSAIRTALAMKSGRLSMALILVAPVRVGRS
jgi:hypothetical protein